MIVGRDLEPVVNAADDNVGGEDIRNRAVLEYHVHEGKVIDIVVVAAYMAFVFEAGQPGDCVRARRDGLRQNRFAVPGVAFDAFEVKRRRKRVAALADHYAAAGEFPVGIRIRVRARVGFFAVDPEDLGAGFFDNLALLLN